MTLHSSKRECLLDDLAETLEELGDNASKSLKDAEDDDCSDKVWSAVDELCAKVEHACCVLEGFSETDEVNWRDVDKLKTELESAVSVGRDKVEKALCGLQEWQRDSIYSMLDTCSLELPSYAVELRRLIDDMQRKQVERALKRRLLRKARREKKRGGG